MTFFDDFDQILLFRQILPDPQYPYFCTLVLTCSDRLTCLTDLTYLTYFRIWPNHLSIMQRQMIVKYERSFL